MPPFRLLPGAATPAWPLQLVGAMAVIAALYLGREVLAPLALALLLTVAAVPVTVMLERIGLPRAASVLVVLLVVVGAAIGLGYLIVTQLLALAEELPRYEDTLRAKVASLVGNAGAFSGLSALFSRLQSDMAESVPAVPVQIADGPLGGIGRVLHAVGLLLPPIATFAITLLLMTFILIRREDVRDRALRLAGVEALHRSTRALSDATTRLSRFLLMQVLCNATFGVSMGVGLWLIGVPNAALWGMLGFALRFIPFVGAPLATVFPLILAFAIGEGWNLALMVVALFAVVDGLVTYVMEPLVYGHSTGTSPLALLISSLFWALVWGPVGLILAPALTACLVVLASHLPTLASLGVVLGDRDALLPADRFYQRVLAQDETGAASVLAEAGEREGVVAAVESLLLPAVARLAAIGPTDEFGAATARRGGRTMVRALELVAEPETPGRADVHALPAGGALDLAAALSVAAYLREQGWSASTTRGAATVNILVVTGAVTAGRLARQAAALRRSGGHLLLMAATEEGDAAVKEARIGHAHTTLPDLAEALQAVMEPQPEAAAA